jgi:hypothetical protein
VALAYDAPSEEQLSEEQAKLAREEKLVLMLKAEEEDALGYAQTEVSEQQSEALRRYYGEKYGDEEEGRSQVTTREVFETIEWTRPDLMRVFGSGGNVVALEETNPEDAKYSKDAADYLQWMFWQDNPGFELLDNFAFDGMLHRRGYIACYWCDYEYRAPQALSGLNIMQVQQLMADPQVEIVAQDFNEESEAGGISLIVRRLKSPARAVIESIAPEDMRLSGRAVSLDKARYVGRVIRMLRGEIVRKWPEKAMEVTQWSGGRGGQAGQVMRAEEVRAERFQDSTVNWHDTADASAEEMEVLEEYLRVDLNDDGYPEMIRSYRLGDIVLEESEVEENPFASWTPIRIPHRFMGLSVHDTTAEMQRINTVLMRAGLDAVYQSVVNREFFDRGKIEADGAINSTYAGVKVGVDGNPHDAVLQVSGGVDTAQVAWTALEMTRRMMEDRTGATRQTRGLDADKLSKDHSGVALDKLQLNADARKEMTARNMANGLGDFFSKLYRLVCRNQNEARQAKVGGKWCQFDPRTWNSDLRVSIYSGGMNRERTLVGLQLIAQEQDKIFEALGPGNPIVTVKNRYNFQEALCREVGYKSADQFFTEVPDVPETGPDGQPVMDQETGQPKTKPWAPEPQPDPAMAKVQADTQAKQAEMQLKAQETQATLKLKTDETQANLQLQDKKDSAALAQQAEKAALDLQLAREKAAAEMDLANRKAEAEVELAWAKFNAEIELAREKMRAEQELARMQIAAQREQHTEATDAKRDMHSEKVSADAKISKNREGGSLSE